MKPLAVVNNLVSKYGTRDPYELADKMCFYIYFENLGTINGYYSTAFDVKSIHINEKLSLKMRELTLAHEIGHAVMHPNLNINFMHQNTYMLKEKYEQQANLFASYLLFPDEILMQYEGYSADKIASILEVPTHIIDIRCKS